MSIAAIVQRCVVVAGIGIVGVSSATADDLCGATIFANLKLS